MLNTKRVRFAVVLVSLLSATIAVWATWTFVQRARQVRTFADLQSMTWLIERQSDGLTLEEAVASVSDGRDGWGNSVIVVQSAEKGYLLIAPGSDGRVDVRDPSSYFESNISDVRGDYSSDIVFRNGEPLTLAGK